MYQKPQQQPIQPQVQRHYSPNLPTIFNHNLAVPHRRTLFNYADRGLKFIATHTLFSASIMAPVLGGAIVLNTYLFQFAGFEITTFTPFVSAIILVLLNAILSMMLSIEIQTKYYPILSFAASYDAAVYILNTPALVSQHQSSLIAKINAYFQLRQFCRVPIEDTARIITFSLMLFLDTIVYPHTLAPYVSNGDVSLLNIYVLSVVAIAFPHTLFILLINNIAQLSHIITVAYTTAGP
jgi:hypothetical protein